MFYLNNTSLFISALQKISNKPLYSRKIISRNWLYFSDEKILKLHFSCQADSGNSHLLLMLFRKTTQGTCFHNDGDIKLKHY